MNFSLINAQNHHWLWNALNRKPQAKQKSNDQDVYQNIRCQDAIFPILEM